MESGTAAGIGSISRLVEFFKQMTSQNQSIDLIDKINVYIEEHYMDQIGINTIADMIDISLNYLSKIYKMKTGEKFVDHLTGVRIKKAMERREAHCSIRGRNFFSYSHHMDADTNISRNDKITYIDRIGSWCYNQVMNRFGQYYFIRWEHGKI